MARSSASARLMRAAGRAASTALRGHELAIASAEVIAARLSMTGAPAAAEAAVMGPEKAEAFAASGVAVAGGMGAIAMRGAQAAAREGAHAAEAGAEMALARSPAEFALAQSRYLSGWFARAAVEAAHWAGMAARTHAEALAPIHKTATDNARRLRK
jgi:hypothetical protein